MRLIVECLALYILVLVLSENNSQAFAVCSKTKKPIVPTQQKFPELFKTHHLSSMLRQDQHWSLFAPAPSSNAGWLVIPATLANGSQIDLFRNKPVSYDNPGF